MRTFRAVVLTVLVLSVLGACGDDDNGATGSATTPAENDAVSLSAELEGGTAEVPAPGDPDGRGTASITMDETTGQVCYDITVENISPPTGAHIHEGAAGAQGGVVITFDPAKIGQGDTCLTGQKTADIERIVANPTGFYVNVHTADFPGGAVRGQLAQE